MGAVLQRAAELLQWIHPYEARQRREERRLKTVLGDDWVQRRLS